MSETKSKIEENTYAGGKEVNKMGNMKMVNKMTKGLVKRK